jgi:hypothetical protein
MSKFSPRRRLMGCLALVGVALAAVACGAREPPPAVPASVASAAAPAATAAVVSTASAAASAAAAAPAATVSTSATTTNQDLADFVARRKQCDHFRGEEGSTPKRKAELAAKLKEFCAGSDAQLSALKQKYRDNQEASKTLAAFDPSIE